MPLCLHGKFPNKGLRDVLIWGANGRNGGSKNQFLQESSSGLGAAFRLGVEVGKFLMGACVRASLSLAGELNVWHSSTNRAGVNFDVIYLSHLVGVLLLLSSHMYCCNKIVGNWGVGEVV